MDQTSSVLKRFPPLEGPRLAKAIEKLSKKSGRTAMRTDRDLNI